MRITNTHPPTGDGMLAVPSTSKIGFECDPFDQESLCLLDFTAEKNRGLPTKLYFIERLGAFANAEGWFMEYASVFEEVDLRQTGKKQNVAAAPAVRRIVSPKSGSLAAEQEMGDYCGLFFSESPVRNSQIAPILYSY